MITKDLIRSGETAADPVRLNKYLSDAGVCSRREADRLIAAGQVLVDGTPAQLGQKVCRGQQVTCRGIPVEPENRLILLAFHKPVGIECTTDERNPDNIISFVHYPARIFPVGRLDKNSSGLILLTNTGELSDQILRGSHFHEKEYEVTVDKPVTAAFLEHMRSGVEITLEDGARTAITRPCRVEQTGPRDFRIILTQGMNRQIRRMCEALQYQVIRLHRNRVLTVKLGDLPVGKYRELTEPEIQALLQEIYAE